MGGRARAGRGMCETRGTMMLLWRKDVIQRHSYN